MAMTQRTRLVATLGGATVLATSIGLYAFYGVHEVEVAEQKQKEALEASGLPNPV